MTVYSSALAVLWICVASGAASATPPRKPMPPDLPATPKPERMVAILDVHTEGVPAEMAAQFQHSLAAQADTGHYALAMRAQLRERMANSTKWTDGCVVGSCLREVRSVTGAEIVLLASLAGSGTSFGSVITLVRTDTGAVVSQASERCDVCTLNEAMSTATMAALRLLAELPERLPDDGAAATAPAPADPAVARLQDRVTAIEHERHVAHAWGTAALLVGLAVGAAGFTLYEVKGHPNYGLVGAATGGGLALGGVIAVSF